MAKLYHSDATSVSWGGKTYSIDEHGAFDVPDEAVPDLLAHGLTPTAPAAPDPDEITVPVSQWKNEALIAKAAELGLELAADIKRPRPHPGRL